MVILSNTITGCGSINAGCGTVIGSGTVYIGPGGLIPVVSSGTAIGCASKVVGCGTMLGSTGTFAGTGVIVGCGEGSGTATLTGSGTVYPAIGGGLISFVSSGIVTGSGRVKGCGTITGAGVFTATGPYTSMTTTSARNTVEVYVSYCPTDLAGGLPRIGGNGTQVDAGGPYRLTNGTTYDGTISGSNITSPWSNSTFPSNSTRHVNTTDVGQNCRFCPNSALCCPIMAKCDSMGKCPWDALVDNGYVKYGLNVANRQNLSDDSIKPVCGDFLISTSRCASPSC